MKKCPKPLGYGIRRTPVVLGLSGQRNNLRDFIFKHII